MASYGNERAGDVWGGQQASGWAVGGVAFAGAVMVTIGAFQAIAGLTAILHNMTGMPPDTTTGNVGFRVVGVERPA